MFYKHSDYKGKRRNHQFLPINFAHTRTTFFVWNILRKNAAPRLRQSERKESRPRSDRYILFSVDCKGHWRRIHRRAALEVPKSSSRSGLQRDEVSLRVTREDQPPCGAVLKTSHCSRAVT